MGPEQQKATPEGGSRTLGGIRTHTGNPFEELDSAGWSTRAFLFDLNIVAALQPVRFGDTLPTVESRLTCIAGADGQHTS